MFLENSVPIDLTALFSKWETNERRQRANLERPKRIFRMIRYLFPTWLIKNFSRKFPSSFFGEANDQILSIKCGVSRVSFSLRFRWFCQGFYVQGGVWKTFGQF